jgi:hypothetical protein
MKSGVVIAKLVDARNIQYNVILTSDNIDELENDLFSKTRQVLDLHGHNDSKLLNVEIVKGEIIF